ncbi:MAG: outer membrane lipoprotein chaperone LolA [Gammaproteobacteria bacterium]|jgi:outer membrane lipoprotein carrier protein
MPSRPFRVLCTGLLLLVSLTARAGSAPAYLDRFFEDLSTLEADFEQQVVDSGARTVQSSRGQLWIMRPGRFRWDYLAPYKQQLVADGERVWSYDEDLEQVTVQAADEVLTATPAMLLSGNRPLDEVFTFEELAPNRVRLTPRTDDSNITSLMLAFAGGLLTRIEARDTFGNTTTFRFTNLVRNPTLDQQIFRFEPPPGADVVGDVD